MINMKIKNALKDKNLDNTFNKITIPEVFIILGVAIVSFILTILCLIWIISLL